MSRSDDPVSPYLRRRLRTLAEMRAEIAGRSAAGAKSPSPDDGSPPDPGQAADRDPPAGGEDAP